MGRFVVFEGGEGSGKSTQARALDRRLSQQGLPVVLTHEPGGTALGAKLRHLVKWGSHVTPQTELLLILAARSQLVKEVIRPALGRGSSVVCDRYTYSTLAYQGYGREMDVGLLTKLNDLVTEGLYPDLVVLLDADPVEGLQRKKGPVDRFEREDLDFHRAVRDGYLQMARDEPERWFVIDASLSRKEIEEQVWGRVSALLP